MGDSERDQATRAAKHAAYLAVGLADAAVSQAVSVARQLWSAVHRSDLQEMASEGTGDLAARGKLAMARHLSSSEPHMELLAQRVASGARPVDG